LQLADRISLIGLSSTMRVAAEAERLKREGVDVVDFGAGEPDFPTPDNVKHAAVRALEENFTRYTNAGGTLELKQAICDRHAADYGTSYSPGECVVTVGGKHSIFNLVQVLVNPGDEVIIPVPYWVTYRDVVNYAGGVCVFAETDAREDFRLTARRIEERITPRTRALIVNSPTNPSGAVIGREKFERILRLARKHGFWLITDECYCRLVYDGEPFSIAAAKDAKDTVLVAGSLSKTYAMTGWRIGYTLAPAAVAGATLKLQSHTTSNPTSIAQKAAVEALRGPQEPVARMLAEYRRRRDFVVERLRGIGGVSVAEPKGAFYAYPDVRACFGRDGIAGSAQFAERLLETARVAVVPGEAFGTDSHVRISYATSMTELDRGLARIRRFVEGLAG
jgi:aspartate aminotransferase